MKWKLKNTIASVGSTSKPVGAMDARWQQGNTCMILRHLRQGYGHSWEAKQCWVQER
jgi:hypothetical protein